MTTIEVNRLTLTTTDRWMLSWWGTNVLVFAHVVFFQPPLWVTYAHNAGLWVLGAALSARFRTIRRIFTLATVAGIVELGVDSFLVETTGTLVYPESLPMVLSSPLHMPLAWAIVTTHLGYFAVRLEDSYGPRAGILGPSIAAMVLIGIYEIGAKTAGIWMYSHAPFLMIGDAPLYIIVGEGLMFATLSTFIRQDAPILAGLGFGLVITGSYLISYYGFVVLAIVL